MNFPKSIQNLIDEFSNLPSVGPKTAERYVFYLLKKNIMELFILLGVIGPWQIILIVAIVLLLFGGKKIPELMKGLGKGMKEFKKASKDDVTTEDEEKK